MAKASVNGKTTDDKGQITPQEMARIDASVRGLEQAPSSRMQLGAFANWKQVQDQLGQPFNNERIPLNKLKLMRRDTMIAFGSHFLKTPLVRAPWYMKCPDPQVAAFMDGALRPIMGTIVTQCLQKFDFGFQAIAKRYAMEVPDATYINPDTGEEVPAWDASVGGIVPMSLKPFVTLPPEGCTPIFDDTSGEFAGITYKPPSGGGAPSGTGAKAKGPGGSEGEVEIDLYHSLWVTNEKDSVFGNLYGYPRNGYAYPYWWSYWFRWAIADRAFERKGDPQTVVRHPEGDVDLGNGETVTNAEYALMMADRLRSGAGVALPSTPYFGLDDKPSSVQEWSIEFLKDGLQLDPFDKSFDYIDVMKLRSIFVPEQALIEGGGGTSSRNVAKEMSESLDNSQAIELDEIINMVNRFIIPQLMIVNFPEQWNAGIRCRMTTRGFAASDVELLNQIVQLIGQDDPDKLGVDIREGLRQLGLPLVSAEKYEQMLAQKAAAAAAEGPGAVAPTSDSSGVVPVKGQPPSTAANSPGGVGFAYTAPIHMIDMNRKPSLEFAAELPSSIHFQDKAVKAMAVQLWNTIHDFYADQYQEFCDYLDGYEGELHLSEDEEETDGVELAASDFVKDWARRIVQGWEQNRDKYDAVLRRAEKIIDGIVKRAGALTRKEASLDVELSNDNRELWVQSRVGDMLSKTISTTRSELETFVANFISEDKLDPKELSSAIRAHFEDFPEWKADRYARTETRDAYNAGVLLTGRENGLRVVQAVDAQLGESDAECNDRDGQFYTIDQAMSEEEHPNGTLGWRLMGEPIALSRVDEIPGKPNLPAWFDSSNNRVYLTGDINPESERDFLFKVGDRVAA